jgi:hypothetical protein
LAWLAILILATLRSPFLPQAYAAFPPLWLLTLFGAVGAPSGRTLWLTLSGWAALNVYWPQDWSTNPRLLALVSGLPQAVSMILVVLVVRRALAPLPQATRGRENGPAPALTAG